MFGLTVSEYPELARCKKELNLLQKLYGLYNTVIDTVNGYYDILWTEVDIEKINSELLDFQNRYENDFKNVSLENVSIVESCKSFLKPLFRSRSRHFCAFYTRYELVLHGYFSGLYRCRKLPKALREWDAYNELKQKIDDFNECCPLLELMSNKAMKDRHWERIANCTAHTFDFDSDNFLLRNIMEAPLLENKEDIEVSFFLMDRHHKCYFQQFSNKLNFTLSHKFYSPKR